MENWVLPFAITVIYTIFTIVIGILPGRKMDMTQHKNWGVAGGSMGPLMLFFMLGGSQISAYTFMGAPGTAWSNGVSILYVSVYLALMQMVGYLINPRIIRLSRKSDILTQSEAFGVRYESRFVRAFASFAGSLTMVCYAVVQVVGCGYIVNVMSGGHIPMWLAELIILICVFSYVYSSGLASVGWVSIMQGLLMFIIAIIAAIFLCYKFTGDWTWFTAFETIAEVSPEHLTLPGPTGTWTPLFWSTSILITTFSVWPNFWMAATGGKTEEDARRATTLVPLYQLVMVPMMIVGFVCIFAMSDYTGEMDKVGLTLSMESMPWYLVGLMGAGTLAAAQSSCAPLFQCLAFTWTNDVFVPYGLVKDENKAKVQRLMLIPFMFVIILPLSIINPSNLVNILNVGYGFLGQIFPLVLGVFAWPRSSKAGVCTGLAVGLTITILFTFVWVHPLGIHAGIWGLLFNLPISIIVSLMTKPAKRETLDKFFEKDFLDKAYETA